MLDNGSKGYTLIELSITITIAAILCGLGFHLGSMIERSRQRTTIDILLSGLTNTRSTAVAAGRRACICAIDAKDECQAEWSEARLAIFIDDNGNRARDSDEDIVAQFYAPSDNLHAQWRNRLGDSTVTYQPDGTVVSNGTITLLTTDAEAFAMITLNNGGRPRLDMLR